MRVLHGPSGQPDPHVAELHKHKKIEEATTDPKFFHPHGRQHFQSEHGFAYPLTTTPFEEALTKFQEKQLKVRAAALKTSLKKRVG